MVAGRAAATASLAETTVRRVATTARLGDPAPRAETPVRLVAAEAEARIAVAADIPEAGTAVARNSWSRGVLNEQEAKHMSSMRVAAWFTWFAAWNWLMQRAMISRERFAKGVIRP